MWNGYGAHIEHFCGDSGPERERYARNYTLLFIGWPQTEMGYVTVATIFMQMEQDEGRLWFNKKWLMDVRVKTKHIQ
jgi:hypothetical protein